MRKLVASMAVIGLSMAIGACNKTEPAANEAVVEETAPVADEAMDANAAMEMNAADVNAADANAADGNATEQGSTDH